MSARTPARRPVATWPALLVAIALVAAAVVGVRDLVVSLGWAQGVSWSETVVERADGLSAGASTTIVGVVGVVLGLLLVLSVLRPASRTHLRSPSQDAEVWISRRAVSALAEQTVERVPGVHEVSASTGRRLTVRVSTTDPEAEQHVREAVDTTVGGYLTRPAKITVRKATP